MELSQIRAASRPSMRQVDMRKNIGSSGLPKFMVLVVQQIEALAASDLS